MSFANVMELLEAGEKPGPPQSIRLIADEYRKMHGADGSLVNYTMLVESIEGEAASELIGAGWEQALEDGDACVLSCPDDVARRCRAHPDWLAFQGTYANNAPDDFPGEEIGYFCTLYVWCWERGLL